MSSPSGLVVIGVILPLLGVIAVLFRFYIRFNSKHFDIGADDWLILAACLLVCGMGVMQIIGTKSKSVKPRLRANRIPLDSG